MATPMIIIGIGTSGLKVIEQTQKFYYETTKVAKPDYVEYIYLETDKNSFPTISGTENPIKRVYISLKQMGQMTDEVKESTGAKWLPSKELVVNAGMGAGGIRPVGRLALWGRNDEVQGGNFSSVYNTIKNAYQQVLSHTIKETKDNEVVTYIVGSLTGGTGSGIFIDMAYMVREIIQNTKNVYGLFLLPNTPGDIRNEELKYANTYGALLDLEQYNLANKKYVEQWPTSKKVEFLEPPFELAHFISQDYKDGSPAISTLDGLYKMAGLFMFLNIMGMHEKRFKRLVDTTSTKLIDKYASFGLSGIHFPKDQIQEYVAAELGRELFARWIDETNYITNNETQPINYAVITQGTEKKWDDFLTQAFQALNTVGGQNLVQKIEDETIKINKKEIGESEAEYIRKMFSSRTVNQLYSTVQGNLQVAVDTLIDKLYDFNNETINKFQNLYFAKQTLDGFVDAIKNCLNYWETLGIIKDSSIWEDFLQKQLKWATTNKYKGVLEQDSVLADRLQTIFEYMKMHLMASKLEEIIDYITKHDIPYTSVGKRKELPKIKKFDEFIKVIRQTDGSIDSTKQLTLRYRMEEITRDVKDTTIPILRIFPAGSFEQEVRNAKNNYGQKTNGVKPQHTDLTREDLWVWLNKNNTSEDLQTDLFELTMAGYKDSVDVLKCIDDRYDLSTYIENNPDEVNKIAKRGVAGFISLVKPLDSSTYIPRMIIANDRNKVTKTIQVLSKKNNTDFKDEDNNVLTIGEVKNMVVFFDEKGNFEPLKDLSYIKQMEDVFHKMPRNLAGSGQMTDERWKGERQAYLPVSSSKK